MNFDPKKYKIYTWKSGVMLHWIINPGLAINELILGQRIPKVSLEDKTVDKPRVERSYVPCPHCKTLHDSRTWSTQNGTGFKNWFGLYCPDCGEVIPCLMNAFTFIILAVTFPLWGWFRGILRKVWLDKQAQRFEQLGFESVYNPFAGSGWVKQGLIWAAFMYVLMTLIFPLLTNDPITQKDVLVGVPIWLVGGLIFGYFLKRFMDKKGDSAVT
ncbi:MAG: hypothetical protein KTR30_28020 [Saprospiraceae bacterium]|nr:hypothetical protein [Saprospiraceae bacterium]